jgi:hypothetical protein
MSFDDHELRVRSAEACIRGAFACFVDARKELTLWVFEEYVRENVQTLGGHGFVRSIGEAIIRATDTPK